MTHGTLRVLLFLSLLAPGIAVQGADPLQEAELAQGLARHLSAGQLIWLDAGQDHFPAIYSESTTAAQGGIILLHDLETHPDWPAVIAPLRKSLPEHGWTVLSVQMPRLPPGAVSDNAAIRQLITEAKPRIQAAVDYLKGKEFKKLALIGHGLGAVQGLAYLTEAGPGEKTILGLVSISGRRPAQAAELLPLREILPALDARIALFDIHAGREGNHGQLDAAGAKRYQPFGILGADYTYRGFELLLTSRVQGWLKKNVVKSTFAEPLPVSKN